MKYKQNGLQKRPIIFNSKCHNENKLSKIGNIIINRCVQKY